MYYSFIGIFILYLFTTLIFCSQNNEFKELSTTRLTIHTKESTFDPTRPNNIRISENIVSRNLQLESILKDIENQKIITGLNITNNLKAAKTILLYLSRENRENIFRDLILVLASKFSLDLHTFTKYVGDLEFEPQILDSGTLGSKIVEFQAGSEFFLVALRMLYKEVTESPSDIFDENQVLKIIREWTNELWGLVMDSRSDALKSIIKGFEIQESLEKDDHYTFSMLILEKFDRDCARAIRSNLKRLFERSTSQSILDTTRYNLYIDAEPYWNDSLKFLFEYSDTKHGISMSTMKHVLGDIKMVMEAFSILDVFDETTIENVTEKVTEEFSGLPSEECIIKAFKASRIIGWYLFLNGLEKNRVMFLSHALVRIYLTPNAIPFELVLALNDMNKDIKPILEESSHVSGDYVMNFTENCLKWLNIENIPIQLQSLILLVKELRDNQDFKPEHILNAHLKSLNMKIDESEYLSDESIIKSCFRNRTSEQDIKEFTKTLYYKRYKNEIDDFASNWPNNYLIEFVLTKDQSRVIQIFSTLLTSYKSKKYVNMNRF